MELVDLEDGPTWVLHYSFQTMHGYPESLSVLLKWPHACFRELVLPGAFSQRVNLSTPRHE